VRVDVCQIPKPKIRDLLLHGERLNSGAFSAGCKRKNGRYGADHCYFLIGCHLRATSVRDVTYVCVLRPGTGRGTLIGAGLARPHAMRDKASGTSSPLTTVAVGAISIVAKILAGDFVSGVAGVRRKLKFELGAGSSQPRAESRKAQLLT
jgi:hypothetical protein